MPLYITLAWRYLWSPNRDSSITSMVRICFISIFLGTLSLTLTLCIMRGFEQATEQKLQSISPSIMIRPAQDDIDTEKIQEILTREYPDILASAPNMQQFVMVQDPHAKALSTIATLKAIDPAREAQVTKLESMILESTIIVPCASRHAQAAQDELAKSGGTSLESLVYDNRVIIGSKLAKQLERTCGDTITLWYSPNPGDATTLKKTTVVISGIFSTGIEEYDLNLIIANLEFAQELYPDQPIDEIGIKLTPRAHTARVTQKLKDQFDTLEVVSWTDLYPALVAALKLEKYAMFFVILLITLVACMNMMALLFMQITQKHHDIAILQACGYTPRHVRTTFFCMGGSLALVSACSGLVSALLVGILLQRFPFITLPDVYYTTQLPIALEPWIFVSVFCTVIVLTLIALMVPLKSLGRITIAHVLRFEG